MKKITVVTVNYNSEKATQKLLDSLKKIDTTGFGLDIVVVDNGSKIPFKVNHDDVKERIKLIRSNLNYGFTGGNNIGIKYALENKADRVLIINNDTTVEHSALIHLESALNKQDGVGVAVPKIYFSKNHEYHKTYKESELGRVIWFAGGVVDWKNVKSEHVGMDEVDKGQYDKEKNIEFATGCCMLVKREVFEKIGLFDERYFLYYEDSDLTERIKKSGYAIKYVPGAIVHHDNAGSTGGSGSGLHDYFLTRNQMLFGMRYAPLKSKIALIRQSFNLLRNGRKYQRKGIGDYYKRNFGKGSFFDK